MVWLVQLWFVLYFIQAGCVLFPPVPQCDVKVLLLIYSPKKHAFVGLIPIEQVCMYSPIKLLQLSRCESLAVLYFVFISNKKGFNSSCANLNAVIQNSNRAEWSPVRSVIVRVVKKAELNLFSAEYSYRLSWTTQSCYQLLHL